ncbi:hypothetical protein [Streptococcus porcinus]
MKPQELFDKVKELIAKKDLASAKDFITENKDALGSYFEEAKGLIEGSEGVNDLFHNIKGLFKK